MAVVSLKRSHARRWRDRATCAWDRRTIEVPAPQSTLDPARRSPPRQIGRVDDEQREQHGDQHVAGDGHGRRQHAEQRQIGAHAADVNGEERGDERERPAAIDRGPRSFGGVDLGHEGSRSRLVREPELVDDGFVGLGRRAHVGDHDVPGDAEDPVRTGDRDDPCQVPSARKNDQQHDRRHCRTPRAPPSRALCAHRAGRAPMA